MDDFTLEMIDEIIIVKVNLSTATHRDAQPFWEFVQNHLIFYPKKIIIDISLCDYIDSTFVGMIIKILRKVNEKNIKLKLVFPQLHSIEAFRLVGIVKVLSCYDTLDQAIEDMNKESSHGKIKMDTISFTS